MILDRATLRAMIAETCRAHGCTCEPEIYATHQPAYGTFTEVTIAHDDDCPAANSGSALGFAKPPNPKLS